MIRVRNRHGFVALCILAAGLVLIRMGPRRPAAYRTDWLLVSTPIFSFHTNAGRALPQVAFCVSNVGPSAVDFCVAWFECRTKRDRTVMSTNQLASFNIPLPPGTSTNLAIDVRPTGVSVEEWLCCCQVQWVERWTGLRRAANMLNNWMQLRLNIALFEPKALTSGLTFAANIEVADYFRLIYGFPRPQSRDAPAQQLSLSAYTNAIFQRRYGIRPNAQTEAENAFLMFSSFCQNATNSSRDAELAAPLHAAPPHR